LRLGGATAAAIAGLMLVMPIANHLIGAQRSGVELSLVIFDLGGITKHGHVDVFPPLGVADPVAVSDGCYSPIKWDSYAPWTDTICPIGFDPIRAYFAKAGGSPWLFWLRAVVTHPAAYVEHRLTHWNIATRFLVRDVADRAVPDASIDNEWHYQVTPSPFLKAVDQATVLSAQTPLGWPCVWIALAIGVLLVSSALPSRAVIIPIAMSGLMYALGYAIVSVASELRYYLWTYMAIAVAAVIAIADMVAVRARLTTRHSALIATPPVLIAVIALLWRIMPGL
jgi:hypothetical protein